LNPSDPAAGAAVTGQPLLLPEFAPQSGVLLTWPHSASDWHSSLEVIDDLYVQIAASITRFEELLVICRDSGHRLHVRGLLERGPSMPRAVRFACVPTDDTWVRDYGPIVCRHRGHLVLHDYTFDGWGGKYSAEQDNRVTGTLYRDGVLGTGEYLRHSLVLEGGSIDTDGCGTLLTTTRCLLGSGRNPGFDRERLERGFREELGITRVLWLDHGELAGDDTDAHVDMLARFCDAATIAFTSCDHRADEHHEPLAAMRRQLESFRTPAGEPYRLVPLPLPQAIRDVDGRRLPASYANFLILNGAVLVPVYDDPADAQALAALAGAFPGRELVPLDCRALIRQNGSLHCATMQLPAGVLSDSEGT